MSRTITNTQDSIVRILQWVDVTTGPTADHDIEIQDEDGNSMPSGTKAFCSDTENELVIQLSIDTTNYQSSPENEDGNGVEVDSTVTSVTINGIDIPPGLAAKIIRRYERERAILEKMVANTL